MDVLLPILANNIAPIFLAIGAGYTLARFMTLSAQSLSKVVLYIFAPCLVYASLISAQIRPGEVYRIVLIALASVVVSGGLALLIARLMSLRRSMTVAFMLVAMFGNTGNYGLSLNRLAYGADAFDRAVIYFVASSVMVYTIGMVLASSSRVSPREALLSVLKYPPIYAVLLALVTVLTRLSPPAPIVTTVELLGSAAIPTLLLLLGIQMAKVRNISQLRLAGLASVLRLIIAPFIALGLAALVSLKGPALQASVTEASMPTAVIITLLATEFEIESDFVMSTVVLSTLFSPISLTLLVAFLN